VQINPRNVQQERNAAMRHLFWYLKAKLEAVAFQLGDGTRMFPFEREFFPFILTEVRGRQQTMYDAVLQAGVDGLRDHVLSDSDAAIALPGGP
jgi:hypothetical protein